MKYTYFFLMSAFILSLSHTTHLANSSKHIKIDIKEIHGKHISSNRHKKTHSKYVRLDRYGIVDTTDAYQVNNTTRFNLKILHKTTRV